VFWVPDEKSAGRRAEERRPAKLRHAFYCAACAAIFLSSSSFTA
jgi:hypothetical protein